MYRKVDAWVDLVKLEHEILKFWEDTQAFDKLRKKNEGKPHWSFLDGPITANNPMGVHHAWGRTLKDSFQRYWAMNGRELRYQNGFDCQGLWVEVEVEKELGFNSKRDIEEFGIDKFVNLCKERVRKYSAVQTQQSIRLGYWMDWNNSYYTMSEENNYTIWSFLKKCHERGKIYRGHDVMPWSGRSGTGYSQMEIVEGRKLVAHRALFVKFPLIERPGENLLVWTTTPWTLSSNIAAAVNVDLDYVKLRSKGDGELYYFAADNLNFQRLKTQFEEKKEWVDGVPKLKTIAQIFESTGGYEIEGTVKGAEMVGWRYRGPFDELEAQNIKGGYPFTDPKIKESAVEAHRVIDGGRDSTGNPIVVAGEGSGIVHIAPGCGDIDHIIGKQLGLPQIAPLKEDARFMENFGPLTGRHAVEKETVDYILDNLKNKSVLVWVEKYPHVYPHCWRSGDELVFRLVDEWYINMDWRDEIKKVVKDIRWIPEWGQERELEWLTNMHDWMISKKRFWGLALPIWVCDNPNCGHWDVIGGREELKARAVEGWAEFEGHSPHRPWIDGVKIKCEKCGSTATRVKDVGNPWLDAGIVPYSTVKYNSDREYWKKWMPADLVLECFPGQFRNWFYSLLATSTMMENIAPFKTLLGHALVRDEKGNEMHKSTGNAIWFEDAAEKMGADVMRWIYCGQDTTVNLNFGYNVAREVRGKFFNTLWNTYAFYINYARIINFVPPAEPTPIEKRPDFDRWILSNLQLFVKKVRTAFEDFNIRAAVRAAEDFMEDLSNWYIRQSRRRFWRGDDDADSQLAYETLYECLYTTIRLLAPMIPFVTEEIYQNLVRSFNPQAPESIHHTDFPEVKENWIDEELSAQMKAITLYNGLGLSARERSKIKVRQPLSRLIVGPASKIDAEAARRFADMLEDSLNVKKIEVMEPGTASPVSYGVKPNLKTLGSRMGSRLKDLGALIAQEQSYISERRKAGDETFTLNLSGESIILSKDDLLFEEVMPEGLVVADEGSGWVAVDTVLTEDLRLEGLMRDLLRNLQVMRKNVGLEVEDRIALSWNSNDNRVGEIFNRWAEFVSSELLCTEIKQADEIENSQEIKVGDLTAQFGMLKTGKLG